jgi:REP element-mobilizing transposase RayT
MGKMTMDKLSNRKSIRLKGYDYSLPGYYFITFCTHDRRNLFGDIHDNEMHLNVYGRIVCNEWKKSFIIRHELLSDEFVVMPNHFHGIVKIIPESGMRPHRRAALQSQCGIIYRPPKSLSSFMAGFKSSVTKRINKMWNISGVNVLQYRYHDHIIRNEKELYFIRQYIKNNPANWIHDTLNPDNENCVMETSESYGKESRMI